MNRLEHGECRAFIDWTRLVTYEDEPLFERIVHVPNERDKPGANVARLVAAGLRVGFPDYMLFIPTPQHAGLCIEAKRLTNSRTSPEQLAWIQKLRGYGYHAEVCRGALEMIGAVHRYVKYAPGKFIDRTRLSA